MDGKASGRSPIRSYIFWAMIDSGQANVKALGTQPDKDATKLSGIGF